MRKRCGTERCQDQTIEIWKVLSEAVGHWGWDHKKAPETWITAQVSSAPPLVMQRCSSQNSTLYHFSLQQKFQHHVQSSCQVSHQIKCEGHPIPKSLHSPFVASGAATTPRRTQRDILCFNIKAGNLTWVTTTEMFDRTKKKERKNTIKKEQKQTIIVGILELLKGLKRESSLLPVTKKENKERASIKIPTIYKLFPAKT